MDQSNSTYHANFLLGDDRVATVVVPRDITVAETERIARILCGLAKRSNHVGEDSVAA